MNQVPFMAVLVLMPGALLPAEPQPAVSIRIYDRSSFSHDDMDRALRELELIYRSAGIKALVRNCPLPDSCGDEFGVNEVGVRLISGLSPSRPRELAVAFVARGGKLSTIYAGAVVEAANRAGVTTGCVLSYTIAHEVAHLLGLSHSRAGVMCAHWADPDYRAMNEGRIFFSRAEAAAIRRKIANINKPLLDRSAR
jgi:hypothetical protein